MELATGPKHYGGRGKALDELTKLLGALASVMWPCLAAWVLWALLPVLRSVVKTRAFTIRLSGFEITVQQVADQLKNQLQDLQLQLAEVQRERPPAEPDGAFQTTETGQDAGEARAEAASGPEPGPVPAGGRPAPGRILWVDDQPDNNALEIAQLEGLGYGITLATSTDDALAELERGRNKAFSLVISDMGRSERGGFVEDAGLQLLQRMRSANHRQAFMIYTSPARQAEVSAAVAPYGNADATASPTRLLGWIMDHGRR